MTPDHTDGSTPLRLESRRGAKLEVVGLPGGAGIEAHLGAWGSLARECVEANVFYEPELLLPALAHLAGDANVEIVLVYEADPSGAAGLCGLFPIERRSASSARPAPHLVLWKHLHCFLCTPLLRRGREACAMEAFFAWLATQGALFMEIGHVAADGPFAEALSAELAARGRRIVEVDRFERSAIHTRESAEAYVEASTTPKRRREAARLERRLGEHGEIGWRALGPGDDPGPWIEDFLALEASGWKGRAGSAMRDSEGETAYFRDAATNAFRAGRLMMLSMDLDGRPVAMKCNFMTDPALGGGFAFKIAFDEAWSRYSPGVLLELENLRRIHAPPRVEWMDSCADPGHSLKERVWRERRPIADYLIATGRPGSGAALAAFAWALARKRAVGAWLGREQAGEASGHRGPKG